MMMTATPTTGSIDSGLERVRARLLSELHAGKLRPGDRVPSVRRLADLTGMNRKTIHRAYTTLVQEGLLEARPGSGTYITESTGPRTDEFSADELLQALSRSRAEATELGVDVRAYVSFLSAGLADGLRGLPVTVAEESSEMAQALAAGLRDAFGVETRPLRLQEVDRDPQLAIRGTRVVVTGPDNVERLTAVFAPLGISVFGVEFDGVFPRTVARIAATAPVLLIVPDGSFQRAFLRQLEAAGAGPEATRNVRIVTPGDAERAIAETRDARVYVSPACADDVELPAGTARLDVAWRLVPSSVETLRAKLAMDVAMRQAAARRVA